MLSKGKYAIRMKGRRERGQGREGWGVMERERRKRRKRTKSRREDVAKEDKSEKYASEE